MALNRTIGIELIVDDKGTPAVVRFAQTAKRELEGLDAGFGRSASSGSKLNSVLTETPPKIARVGQTAKRELSGVETGFGQGVTGGKNLNSVLGEMTSSMGGLGRAGTLAAGGIAALVGTGIISVLSGIVQEARAAAVEINALETAVNTVKGGAAEGGAELDFLRGMTYKLGMEFNSTAQSSKSFLAAVEDTELEGEPARQVILGLASASKALGLTSEQTQGSLVALEQMMSKGKVSAEELRGQLGERIPGAFRTAAKAMGMTTAELDAALAKGEIMSEDMIPALARAWLEQFGPAAVQAADDSRAASARFDNSMQNLSATLGKNLNPTLDDMLRTLTALADWFNGFLGGKPVEGLEMALEKEFAALETKLQDIQDTYNDSWLPDTSAPQVIRKSLIEGTLAAMAEVEQKLRELREARSKAENEAADRSGRARDTKAFEASLDQEDKARREHYFKSTQAQIEADKISLSSREDGLQKRLALLDAEYSAEAAKLQQSLGEKKLSQNQYQGEMEALETVFRAKRQAAEQEWNRKEAEERKKVESEVLAAAEALGQSAEEREAARLERELEAYRAQGQAKAEVVEGFEAQIAAKQQEIRRAMRVLSSFLRRLRLPLGRPIE